MDTILQLVASNACSATVLALITAALSRWIRRPAILHALWLLVLLRLFAPPLLTVPLLPVDAAGLTVPAATGTVNGELPAAVVVGGASVRTVSPIGVLVSLWFAGIAAVGLLAMVRTSRLRSMLDAREPTTWPLAMRVDTLSRSIGLRQPPQATVVRSAVPPMLWGPLGSLKLVLPLQLLERLTESERDTLIVHELAHLRRRDHWVRYLELAATLAFWWLPVAWWARRRLRSAEELCCDDLVARVLPGHERAYADCLVKTMDYLSANRTPDTVIACGAGAFAEMKGRILMIMTQPARPAPSRGTRLVLAAVAAVSLAVFPSLTEREARAHGTSEGSDIASFGDSVSLTLEGADLADVLRTFARVTDLNFVVDPRTTATGLLDATVSIHAVDQPWEQVLSEILASQGLSSTLEGNVLWIHPLGTDLEGDRDFTGDLIDLKLEDARLKDVLNQFEKISGLTINLQSGVQRTVTVDLHRVPWDQALELILRISGLGRSRDGTTMDVYPTTTALGRQLSNRELAVPFSPAVPTSSGSLGDSPVYRFKVGGAVTEPRRVSGPDPVVPESALGDRVTGRVVVEAVIDSDGSVREAHAILSPSEAATLATLDAVKQWRFEPATLEGKPVAVRYVLSEHLSLE